MTLHRVILVVLLSLTTAFAPAASIAMAKPCTMTAVVNDGNSVSPCDAILGCKSMPQCEQRSDAQTTALLALRSCRIGRACSYRLIRRRRRGTALNCNPYSQGHPFRPPNLNLHAGFDERRRSQRCCAHKRAAGEDIQNSGEPKC